MRITRNGRGAKKKKRLSAHHCPCYSGVHYDRGYPIGYLMSSNHEMVLDDKMAVASSLSVD